MTILKGEFQTENEDVLYPHTSGDSVFLSDSTTVESSIVDIKTKLNNHTHNDIIGMIPNVPSIATTAEAEAGLDNTKMMTPLRTKEAIKALASGTGGISLNVFMKNLEFNKFTATVATNTFTINGFNQNKSVLLMVYENVILNDSVEYNITSAGVVTLSFQLAIGESVFYKVVDTSYAYNDLSGKPAVVNNLTTGGTTDILAAEQGKVLNNKIELLNNRGYLEPVIIDDFTIDFNTLTNSGFYRVYPNGYVKNHPLIEFIGADYDSTSLAFDLIVSGDIQIATLFWASGNATKYLGKIFTRVLTDYNKWDTWNLSITNKDVNPKSVYKMLPRISTGTLTSTIINYAIDNGNQSFSFECDAGISDCPIPTDICIINVNATETYLLVECHSRYTNVAYYNKMEIETFSWLEEKWRRSYPDNIYTDVNQIDPLFTKTTPILDVIKSMPAGYKLEYLLAGSDVGEYPIPYGILYINKYCSYGAELEVISRHGQGARVKETRKWISSWQESDTEFKGWSEIHGSRNNIVLTPNTGFKIKEQECFVSGNIFYFTVEVAKLDDTVLSSSGAQAAIVLPTSLRPKIETPALSNPRTINGATTNSIYCNCTISPAGNVWIAIPTNTTIFSVQIKGTIIL